jgi:putative transposase
MPSMAMALADHNFAPFRFWCTLKYEEVYLKAYESVAEARSSIGCYLEFYNTRRPHSALDRRTPDQAYYASLPLCVAA